MDKEILIDGIYEAAVVGDFWPAVIEKIAEATGCYGGSLFSLGSSGMFMTASRSCEPHLDALLKEGWAPRNIRAQRLVAMAQNGFVTDFDLCTKEEIETHEIYTGFLRPRGLGWSIGTHIVGADGDISIFSIDQLYDRGPVSDDVKCLLDELRPHIARAAMLAGRIRLQRIETALSTLELLNIPAATVGRNGKVSRINKHFDDFHEKVSVGAGNILSIKDAVASDLLRQALQKIHLHDLPRSVPVLMGRDQIPFVVHIIPVLRHARDIFSQTDAIVAIVPLSSPGLPFKEFVKSLYDLTKAETNVAEALLLGKSSQEIAEEASVGIETIRSHVKNLLSKTGSKRQAELISKFSGFGLGMIV